jgi:uncharacterized protein YwqG
VPPTQRAQFDAYLKDVYKLPINFSDLVFFIDQTRKLLLSGRQTTQTTTEGQSNAPLIEQMQAELERINQRLEELSSEETFEAYEQIENETERRAKVEEDAAFEQELKIQKQSLERVINIVSSLEQQGIVLTQEQLKELRDASSNGSTRCNRPKLFKYSRKTDCIRPKTCSQRKV